MGFLLRVGYKAYQALMLIHGVLVVRSVSDGELSVLTGALLELLCSILCERV